MVRGFDDVFYAPHSRHTIVPTEAIENEEQLIILAESEEAGVFLTMSLDGKQIFVMGHPEYDRVTLDKEYKRDKAKGLPIKIPENYYEEDDDTKRDYMLNRPYQGLLIQGDTHYSIHDFSNGVVCLEIE